MGARLGEGSQAGERGDLDRIPPFIRAGKDSDTIRSHGFQAFLSPSPTPQSPLLNREGLLGTLMNSLGLMDSRVGRAGARLLP